jgi:hypothetical protein
MNSRKTYWPVGLAGVLLALSFPAAAHHGQAGLFDDTRTIELEGTVKEWSFVNPHPVLVLETTEASGETVQWDVYFGPAAVSALRRRGFSAETFAAGETLVITGHPATAAGVHGIDVWGGDSSVKRGDGSGVP